MEKKYERRFVEVFGIDNYQGSEMEKRALSELAAQMFLATDFELGKSEEKHDAISVVCDELIGVVPTEEIPMNILIAARCFKKNPDAFLDYSRARMWYEGKKEAFDAVYADVCEYAKENHPEFITGQQR